MTVAFDYSQQYDPFFPGTNLVPSLQPVAVLDSSSLLLWDPGILTALNMGLWSNTSSGLYVADLSASTPTLTPVFQTSPKDPGFMGPLSVGVSPPGTKLLISWVDGTRWDDAFDLPKTVVSIIDLATASFPVDARGLPVVWVLNGPPRSLSAGGPTLTWALNDTVALNAFDQVILLKLEGNSQD